MISQKTNGQLLVLIAGTLTMIGAFGFSRYGFPLVLPHMREGLEATYTQMGLVATTNNAGYVISSLFAGILGARFGARRLIIFSMVLTGIATVGTGLAPSIESALALQFLTGLAAGNATVTAMGMIAGWFEPRKRGLATGVVVGGFPASILITSFLLPVILTAFGSDAWRYAWMTLGALVILLGFIDLVLIRNLPLSPGRSDENASPAEAPSAPLQWGKVYKNRTVWLICAINFTNGLAFSIFMTFFAAYLIDQRGLAAAEVSSAWGLIGLIGLGSGLAWGYVSDVGGRKLALAVCYYVFFAALALLTFGLFPGSHFASAVLGGVTVGGGMAVTVALLGDVVGPRLAAAAFGLISLFFNAGQVISPSVAGAAIDATSTFAASLIAGTAFAFLSATLCLFLRVPRIEDAL